MDVRSQPSASQISNLRSRIATLEAQQTRQRYGIVAALLAGLALLLVAQRSNPKSEIRNPQSLTVSSLQLVDVAGHTRAVLELDARDRPRLVFYDPPAGSSVGTGERGNGGTGSKQRTRVELRGANLTLNGTARIQLLTDGAGEVRVTSRRGSRSLAP